MSLPLVLPERAGLPLRLASSPPMHPALQVLYVERFSALTVFGPLVVSVWTGPAPHGVRQAQRIIDEVRQLRQSTHAKLLLYVYLVSEDAVIPEPEARKVKAKIVELFDSCVGIHEGNSLRTSLVRAVTTGMIMMSRRQKLPTLQVVSTSGQAARQLAPLTGGQLDAATILASIEETRSISLA
ncbi:MAG: hypothetical protein MUF34_35140 [Polyangiaceae bacterium]|jgi:hypothetical protein|nr:hypothetical protein [Polyangiaceae bacterium]